jgi:hypothetical protein
MRSHAWLIPAALCAACDGSSSLDPGDDAGDEPPPPPPGPDADVFGAACTPEVEVIVEDPASEGAKRFAEKVPDPAALVRESAQKVCAVLYTSADEVPDNAQVRLYIESFDGVAFAVSGGVHFSTDYLAGYGGDLEQEIRGVLVHEYTHNYQYNDGPGGLVEGIADFVRYRAGYVPLGNRRPGGNYDDAYQTTAFFLDWLDGEHAGFGREINRALDRNDDMEFSMDVFPALAGDDVDTLWSAYQDAID